MSEQKMRRCVLIVCNETGNVKEVRAIGQGGMRHNDHKVFMIEQNAYDSLKRELEKKLDTLNKEYGLSIKSHIDDVRKIDSLERKLGETERENKRLKEALDLALPELRRLNLDAPLNLTAHTGYIILKIEKTLNHLEKKMILFQHKWNNHQTLAEIIIEDDMKEKLLSVEGNIFIRSSVFGEKKAEVCDIMIEELEKIKSMIDEALQNIKKQKE